MGLNRKSQKHACVLEGNSGQETEGALCMFFFSHSLVPSFILSIFIVADTVDAR